VNYDNSLVVTITVTCYSWAPSSGDHLFTVWRQLLAATADIENVLMKGMTHWLSTGFFAYYPLVLSYPAVLAEILSTSHTCQGFTWVRVTSITA